MAYYIFLKSLRSLKEFRKNPHVKISPKSSSTNFQSLNKFKNPIFNLEIPFPYFGPADLAAQSAIGPAGPAPRPPSAAQLHTSGATGPLPPRLHFPSLKSPLKPSPIFNGIKVINVGIKLPGHPSPTLPRPPIKGEHPH
jgi:hypothetical protein